MAIRSIHPRPPADSPRHPAPGMFGRTKRHDSTATTMTTRLVVFARNEIVRDGILAKLTDLAESSVVAAGATTTELARLVRAVRPKVVVFAVHASELEEGDARRVLAAVAPAVDVLFVATSGGADSSLVRLENDSGSAGDTYFLRGGNGAALQRAIAAIARGGECVPDRAADAASVPCCLSELSRRDLEIFTLLVNGLTNQEIADRLGLAEKTVRNHASNIYFVLQLRDRAHAILWALEHDLIRGGSYRAAAPELWPDARAVAL
jgi:DNA-binding NarL/FixJ family response regulator